MAIVRSENKEGRMGVEGRGTREGTEGRYWTKRLRKEQKVKVSAREGEGRKRKKGEEAE